MKKWLAIALLLIPTLAYAAFEWNGASVTVLNGASVTAWNGATVAGGQWYYRAGSDTFSYHSGGYNTGDRFGDHWTPGVTKSITKLSVKIYAVTTASECKVSLWENVTGTWTRRRCAAFEPATGWNDVDISPFSLTSSMDIIIANTCDGTITPYARNNTDSDGYYQSGVTYANECSTATNNGATDWRHAARFWGE